MQHARRLVRRRHLQRRELHSREPPRKFNSAFHQTPSDRAPPKFRQNISLYTPGKTLYASTWDLVCDSSPRRPHIPPRKNTRTQKPLPSRSFRSAFPIQPLRSTPPAPPSAPQIAAHPPRPPGESFGKPPHPSTPTALSLPPDSPSAYHVIINFSIGTAESVAFSVELSPGFKVILFFPTFPDSTHTIP